MNCLWTIKKTIRRIDKEKLVLKCHKKQQTIANVTSSGGSWSKLWDAVLDLGSRHTSGLQNLSQLMAHHGRGRNLCSLCELGLIFSSSGRLADTVGRGRHPFCV